MLKLIDLFKREVAMFEIAGGIILGFVGIVFLCLILGR